MIDEPRIIETTAQATAIIHLVIPRADIQKVMGPAIGEVMATVMGQGIAPTGAVFSHHLRMVPDVWDFEIGVPVSAPVTPAGRVTNSALPATRAARTIYRGNYDGLGDAWGQFLAWIKDQGLTAGPDLWESYLTDPGSNPDPATWETELTQPLVG